MYGYAPSKPSITLTADAPAVAIGPIQFDSTTMRWWFDVRAEAGGPYKLTLTGVVDTPSIEDVYFGDVFLCSGQSNVRELHHSDSNSSLGGMDDG